ncbi:energy-coupling factor ABC transporter permease [Arhodomonas aquaeolei]|uniref:energy-coupling factor ABC transporter permease n=1 Tax=Arhodomonas aquaeolei TaxID=2369 RepID=UPI000375260E|nr:energy-coupling factor ABC transporter permease [Arhodomonas aquaeolei]
MTIPADLFPASWLWLANALLAALLVAAVRRAPWRLLKRSELQHVFYASALLVALLWQMRAGIAPELQLHLLGMTSLTLMFGWRLAIVAGTLAAALSIVATGGAWPTLGISALLGAALPVAITHALSRVVERVLPAHFFIYVWVNAFLGAMISAGTAYLCLIGLASAAAASAAALAPDYLPVLPLLMFPEGFINGAVMTMLVAYRPEWVSSFDDERYLNR